MLENTVREIRNNQNQIEIQPENQQNNSRELSRESALFSSIRRPSRGSSNENEIEMSRTGNTIITDNSVVRITDHNIPQTRPRRFLGNFNFSYVRTRIMRRLNSRNSSRNNRLN